MKQLDTKKLKQYINEHTTDEVDFKFNETTLEWSATFIKSSCYCNIPHICVIRVYYHNAIIDSACTTVKDNYLKVTKCYDVNEILVAEIVSKPKINLYPLLHKDDNSPLINEMYPENVKNQIRKLLDDERWCEKLDVPKDIPSVYKTYFTNGANIVYHNDCGDETTIRIRFNNGNIPEPDMIDGMDTVKEQSTSENIEITSMHSKEYKFVPVGQVTKTTVMNGEEHF